MTGFVAHGNGNAFRRDDAWQKDVRDRVLLGFYGKYALNGRYVFIDKSECSVLIQKRLAVDTMLQGRNGSVCVEEKIVRYKGKVLERFFLETESNTNPGWESEGWMKYGEADYLLYCFEKPNGHLDCYLIEFPALKQWFWPRADGYHAHTMPNTINNSRGRLVPTIDVAEAVKTVRFLASEEGHMLWQNPVEPRA